MSFYDTEGLGKRSILELIYANGIDRLPDYFLFPNQWRLGALLLQTSTSPRRVPFPLLRKVVLVGVDVALRIGFSAASLVLLASPLIPLC